MTSFYSFQAQSLVSNYTSCCAEAPVENIDIHQPTQAQSLGSTMVSLKGEELLFQELFQKLFLGVAPKDAIVNDDE